MIGGNGAVAQKGRRRGETVEQFVLRVKDDPAFINQSVVVAIRFRIDECAKAIDMYGSEGAGCESIPEWFRMLLHREHNRRHRLPKPKPCDYQTAFRTGRPSNNEP